MNKIIIIKDGISDEMALKYVTKVIAMGKVSESHGVPHYCWATHFPDVGVAVWVNKKREVKSADSFTVECYQKP